MSRNLLTMLSAWAVMLTALSGIALTTGARSASADPVGSFTFFSAPEVTESGAITQGPDGNMWIKSGNNVVRMSPTGSVVSYDSPYGMGGPGYATHITTGPDGALWFTYFRLIVRMATDGSYTTYSDPALSNTDGITTGPDGNIWFTDFVNRSIGRITPSGSITTFTHPDILRPQGITAGSDGNLWFTTMPLDSTGTITGPPAIGRITTSGVITLFHDPVISQPAGITLGPDGNVWFADSSAVSRITPTGEITRFTMHAAPISPWNLTAGADGNLWFTNLFSGADLIGRVTTDGVFTIFQDPMIDVSLDIAPDRNGNIWFTNRDSAVIGRVGTGKSIKTPPSAPTKPTAVAGDSAATVSWKAPFNGRSPLTGYTVTSHPDNRTYTTAVGTRTCTVEGLDNGTTYTFTVTATNAIGEGPASPPSDPVVPKIATWYHPITPTRLIDPRPTWKVGPFSTPWTEGLEREVQVTGKAGIPANAKAVVLNVTATDVTSPTGTFISVYPTGTTRPSASSLNASHHQTIANSVTAKIGDGGRITIYNDQKTANVIVDVAGYYTDSPGDGYTALSPVRVIDPRPAWQVGPYGTPWSAGQSRDVAIDTTNAGVPTGADAVVLNVTATDATKPSFITVHPAGTQTPSASNLNLAPGNTIANQVVVKLGAANQISVYNEAGKANVIVDVVGYYKSGSGDAFYPTPPRRIIDPRPAWQVGPFSTPWPGQTTRGVQVTGAVAVPPGAKAVVINVTATDVTSPIGTFMTVFPSGIVPSTSSLNAGPGWTIANAVTAKLSTDGKISIYNEKPTANIIVDVNGYFA